MNAALRLEKEKRKAANEARMWELLSRPEVLAPVMGVAGALALQKMGELRLINRDYAGFLLSAWVALAAAKAGITDKYALGALTAAAAAAYAVSTPCRGDEAWVTIEPTKLLGGDGKLFFLDIPFVPDTV